MTKEHKKNKYLYPLIGIGAFITYFILGELEGLPFSILKIDTNSIPTWLKVIYILTKNTSIIN